MPFGYCYCWRLYVWLSYPFIWLFIYLPIPSSHYIYSLYCQLLLLYWIVITLVVTLDYSWFSCIPLAFLLFIYCYCVDYLIGPHITPVIVFIVFSLPSHCYCGLWFSWLLYCLFTILWRLACCTVPCCYYVCVTLQLWLFIWLLRRWVVTLLHFIYSCGHLRYLVTLLRSSLYVGLWRCIVIGLPTFTGHCRYRLLASWIPYSYLFPVHLVISDLLYVDCSLRWLGDCSARSVVIVVLFTVIQFLVPSVTYILRSHLVITLLFDCTLAFLNCSWLPCWLLYCCCCYCWLLLLLTFVVMCIPCCRYLVDCSLVLLYVVRYLVDTCQLYIVFDSVVGCCDLLPIWFGVIVDLDLDCTTLACSPGYISSCSCTCSLRLLCTATFVVLVLLFIAVVICDCTDYVPYLQLLFDVVCHVGRCAIVLCTCYCCYMIGSYAVYCIYVGWIYLDSYIPLRPMCIPLFIVLVLCTTVGQPPCSSCSHLDLCRLPCVHWIVVITVVDCWFVVEFVALPTLLCCDFVVVIYCCCAVVGLYIASYLCVVAPLLFPALPQLDCTLYIGLYITL